MKFSFIMVSLLSALVITPLNAQSRQGEQIAEQIVGHISSRLSHMKDVGYYKVYHHLAIQDEVREIKVIDNAKAMANNVGIEPESFIFFVKAQMSAAKAIQYRYAADLVYTPLTEKPCDLKTLIRPKLMELDNALVEEIAIFLQSPKPSMAVDFGWFSEKLNMPYLTLKDKKQLFDALMGIKLATAP